MQNKDTLKTKRAYLLLLIMLLPPTSGHGLVRFGRFGTIWHDFHLPSHQHVVWQDGRHQDDRS